VLSAHVSPQPAPSPRPSRRRPDYEPKAAGIEHQLDRHRLPSRDGEVIQTACGSGAFAVFIEPIGALTGPQKLARRRVESLPDGIELIHLDGAFQAESLCSLAHPLTVHALLIRVIAVGRQMPRGIGRSPVCARIVSMAKILDVATRVSFGLRRTSGLTRLSSSDLRLRRAANESVL